MVDVGSVSSEANRNGAQPPPQLDGLGGGPSVPWLGQSGDVQQADSMSGLFLFLFTVVPALGLEVPSMLDFDECIAPDGPFGKVRSSTNPESRVLGNIDSYIGLGKLCARCTVILWAVDI